VVPHQQLHLVGGADERGVATILLNGLTVWRTELHIARRQQVLQHNLLRIRGLVKLVDVDKTYLRRNSFLVLPLLNNQKLPANILILLGICKFFIRILPLFCFYISST